MDATIHRRRCRREYPEFHRDSGDRGGQVEPLPRPSRARIDVILSPLRFNGGIRLYGDRNPSDHQNHPVGTRGEPLIEAALQVAKAPRQGVVGDNARIRPHWIPARSDHGGRRAPPPGAQPRLPCRHQPACGSIAIASGSRPDGGIGRYAGKRAREIMRCLDRLPIAAARRVRWCAMRRAVSGIAGLRRSRYRTMAAGRPP